MAENSWDYVVVGGGHNGLSAACRLAQAGASVLVVERLPILGGLSASHAYLPQAPQHLLSVGAMDDMFMGQTTLTSDLSLQDFGYERIRLEAPYGWIDEDGDTLLLFEDFERTIAEIAYFSPRDAQTYRELRPAIDWICAQQERFFVQAPGLGAGDLLKLGLKLVGDRALRARLGRWLSGSAFEIVGETFESDAMRGLWAFWTSMICPGDLDTTGVYIAAFGGVHRGGVHRPRGGMSSLMRAFQKRLEGQGGSVRTGVAVERILIDGGRATGVRTAQGEILEARRGVLAACAPQVTLGSLLAPDVLDRHLRERIGFIPANSANVAPFKIDMAVGGRLTFPRAQEKRARRDGFDVRRTTLMTGTLEDHCAQLRAMRAGTNIERPPVYMAVLSANDQTVAPEGQDVLYLHSNVAAVPSSGDWALDKAGTSRSIRDSAARFLGGLDAEIGAFESSPADLESRFSTPRGCYFHVDMIPSRMGMNRPAPGLGGYTTPVKQLYIAGAGVHPGGGVLGWPGRLAAECALRA